MCNKPAALLKPFPDSRKPSLTVNCGTCAWESQVLDYSQVTWNEASSMLLSTRGDLWSGLFCLTTLFQRTGCPGPYTILVKNTLVNCPLVSVNVCCYRYNHWTSPNFSSARAFAWTRGWQRKFSRSANHFIRLSYLPADPAACPLKGSCYMNTRRYTTKVWPAIILAAGSYDKNM